jgi:RimJ/RimL family protein N-acetyltransferase
MKKKHSGHYCKICGEHKANEKFSGKGHAQHICKACSKQTVVQRIEIESYLDTLVVFETERLKIRKFVSGDLSALHVIMGKEEVMYAWEHGFTKKETKKWLGEQLKRYRKDGYGYFAVTLKETNILIGQAGLLKSEIDGKEIVELGYIFDNSYWKQGYCIESVNACIRYAFDDLKLKELYCSIRPENTDSIRIVEKTGMEKTGEYIKIYKDKEMRHLLYRKRC